jgi:hypothetical protein
MMEKKPFMEGMRDDPTRRQALARLRDSYSEARDLVSDTHPYANLEWILGEKRNRGDGPGDMDNKMVAVVTLWLEDLALEVERRLPPRPANRLDHGVQAAYRVRHSVATRLRLATEGFARAFRRRTSKPDAPPKES